MPFLRRPRACLVVRLVHAVLALVSALDARGGEGMMVGSPGPFGGNCFLRGAPPSPR